MADIDAAFVKQILDAAKPEREADVEHYCQADDLGARLEVAKRAAFAQASMPGRLHARLEPVSTDKADWVLHL